MQRFVIDTDVMVAGLRSPSGASSALLLAASEGVVTLLASLPLALEYEAVCLRPEHGRAADMTRDEVQIFIDGILAFVEPVEIYFLWRPQLKDPGDEMVLEAAINGQADAIVTFNRCHYTIAPKRFGISVLSPAEALKRIRL